MKSLRDEIFAFANVKYSLRECEGTLLPPRAKGDFYCKSLAEDYWYTVGDDVLDIPLQTQRFNQYLIPTHELTAYP